MYHFQCGSLRAMTNNRLYLKQLIERLQLPPPPPPTCALSRYKLSVIDLRPLSLTEQICPLSHELSVGERGQSGLTPVTVTLLQRYTPTRNKT